MQANFKIPGSDQKHMIIEMSWFGDTEATEREFIESDRFVLIDELSFDLQIIRLSIAYFCEKETQRQSFWRG